MSPPHPKSAPHESGHRNRSLAAMRGGLSVLLGLGLLVSVLSCSAERRYRVLDFFFDGVPDPNAIVDYGPELPPPVDFTKLTGAERAEFLARRVEAPTVYFHKPVEERRCDACHVAEKRDESRPGWMAGMPVLIAPIEELCAICHEPPEAKYVHGPVAMRRCDFCHEPHQSPFPHLLKAESIDAVCAACHVGDTFVTEAEHAELDDAACTDCHDPHASDRLYYLLETAGELNAPLAPNSESGE